MPPVDMSESSEDTPIYVSRQVDETVEAQSNTQSSPVPSLKMPAVKIKVPDFLSAAGSQGWAAALSVFVLGLCLGSLIFPPKTVQSSISQIQSDEGSSGAALISLKDNSVAKLATLCAPFVVNIDTSPVKLGSDKSVAPGGYADMHVAGSGIIVKSDGFILTNSRVALPGSTYHVTLADKRTMAAKFIGRDQFTDLAMIKVDALGLPVAKFADSNSVIPGDWAISMGSPTGYGRSVSLGVVNVVARSIVGVNNHVDMIQTDADINAANSGGPLLDCHGKVIGLNLFVPNNIRRSGFAIPSNLAAKTADEFITKGTIHRPFLGIVMTDIDPFRQKSSNASGVVVSSLVPNSPCSLAGIKIGQVILRFDNKPVGSAKEVRAILNDHKPGDSVPVTIVGDGKETQCVIHLTEYPDL